MTTHTQGVTPETIAAAMAYTKPWEGFNPTVEPDGGGIPTLGHGFALIIGKGGRWEVRGDLNDKLTAAGITLSPDDTKKLTEIEIVLNDQSLTRKQRRDEAKRLTNAHAFPPITRAEAGTLLEVTITEEAEKARDAMGHAAFDALSPPRQSVIIDSAYQRPEGFGKIAGAMGAAAASGDFEVAARVLRTIRGGDRQRVDDNAAHFSDPHVSGVVRAQSGDGLITIAERYGLLTDKHDETDTIERLNPHIDFNKKGAGGVTAGQFVRIAPASPFADIGQTIKEQNVKKPRRHPPARAAG